MAEGGQHNNTAFFREEDTEREKRDTFSPVTQQLDLGELKAPPKLPQNTPNIWDDGAGGLSSPIQSPKIIQRQLSEPDFPTDDFLIHWAGSRVLLAGGCGCLGAAGEAGGDAAFSHHSKAKQVCHLRVRCQAAGKEFNSLWEF